MGYRDLAQGGTRSCATHRYKYAPLNCSRIHFGQLTNQRLAVFFALSTDCVSRWSWLLFVVGTQVANVLKLAYLDLLKSYWTGAPEISKFRSF